MRNVEEFEEHRVTEGDFATTSEDGRKGLFKFFADIRNRKKNKQAICVVTDGSAGSGWEHVSVHVRYRNRSGSWKSRTPSWSEMCRVKEVFWGPEECVVQYHHPESEYINNHPSCLHLWKPLTAEMPRPPKELVGI